MKYNEISKYIYSHVYANSHIILPKFYINNVTLY